MKKGISQLFSGTNLVFLLFALVALFVSTQSFFMQGNVLLSNGKLYTQYNNYVIFKQSWFHLVQGLDLYKLYPDEHWDLYKYSPTFSVFFGIFAKLPDVVGLHLWNLVNALALFFAIRYIPGIESRKRNAMLLFVLIELTTSMQNSQSNGLMVGLIVLAFGLLEREKYLLAALSIVFTIYIKVFGVAAFVLFLFYPKKWKLALYSAMWFVILFILPLAVVNFQQLKFLYASWMELLKNDSSVSYGFSVMGWLKTWFNLDISKTIVLLIGGVLFMLPFLRIKEYKNYHFRLMALASLLVWIIIFNHKAESPTFVIAMSGVAIWFFSQKRKKLDLVLAILAFVFTTLSVTDIFPKPIRADYIFPYAIKVVPCILVWMKIVWEMMFESFTPVRTA